MQSTDHENENKTIKSNCMYLDDGIDSSTLLVRSFGKTRPTTRTRSRLDPTSFDQRFVGLGTAM